jgi:hypothetical protein
MNGPEKSEQAQMKATKYLVAGTARPPLFGRPRLENFL